MAHQVRIPQSVIDRVTQRRGRVHVFDDLEPASTALAVIDMQNAFVAAGAPLEVPVARAIVPNINRLARALRAAGGHVAWIKTTLAASGPNAWPIYHQSFFTIERAAAHLQALAPGRMGHALFAELDVDTGDTIIEKNRFSAMMPGACGLESMLLVRGIDTLVIAGTLTNFCCETTARDAMMRGFRVFFPADANAALSDAEHLASLVNVMQTFGDVRTTDEVLTLMASSRATQGQAGA